MNYVLLLVAIEMIKLLITVQQKRWLGRGYFDKFLEMFERREGG